MSSIPFIKYFGIVPSVPITIGITVTFMSLSFFYFIILFFREILTLALSGAFTQLFE